MPAAGLEALTVRVQDKGSMLDVRAAARSLLEAAALNSATKQVCSNPKCDAEERKGEGVKLSRCGGFKATLFCCTACQRTHWAVRLSALLCHGGSICSLCLLL